MYNFLLLLTIVFAFLRFVLPSTGELHQEDIFKDLAHIFVGILFGYAIFTKERYRWVLFLFLTGVEILAFALSKI